jgi:hypothetical protein
VTCLRAPAGWFCTRKAGHASGCALIKAAASPLREVNMSRTIAPAPPLPDPRLLTCCLAIADDGRVCHDTKGHEDPLHEWERAF